MRKKSKKKGKREKRKGKKGEPPQFALSDYATVCVCVRSTDFQERASAFCTGMCMYQERKPYSACFDACNW